MAMKLSLGSLVAISVSASFANTVGCSAKVTVDMGSNAATGGTTSSNQGAGGAESSTGGAESSTGGVESSTGGTSAQPFEVIAGHSTIFELTADSGWVYWPATDSNTGPTHSWKTISIGSYSAGVDAGVVNTSELATILPAPYGPPQGLKIDGDWMYWIAEAYDVNHFGRLYRCRKPGCSDVQDTGIDPSSYTVAEGQLYWTADSTIRSCSVDNCAATNKTIDVQTPAGQPKFQGASMLAVDGNYLYMGWNGGLARVPLGGSAPYEAIEPDFANDYFVFGDRIYWTAPTKSAVYSCPKSGCISGPTPVVKSVYDAQHITHDSDTIYVVEGGDGRLLRCPITGCDEPVVVLGGAFTTYAAVSDDEYIYAAVGLPSAGLPNVNPADYCAIGGTCTVVLKIPK